MTTPKTITNLHHIPPYAAARDPEGIAYRMMGKDVSFAQLEDRVARLVCVLQQQGVQPGDRVCIYLRKSFESVIAAFAIMGAGAIYVPLDPTAPVGRWAQIITQSGARHLITDASLQARLEGLLTIAPQITHVIGARSDGSVQSCLWEEVAQAPRGQLMERAGDDPAYMMFTSGSTGTPKGMVHTHASGLSYLRAVLALYDMQPSDRIGLHAGLHFDVSLWPMFGAPLAGARCVIVPDAFTRLPAEMSKLVAEELLTIWYSVPFALIQMLENGALDARDMTALRWVVYAGEPFAPDPMRALMRRWPQARFSNNYGPAEVNAVTYMHATHPEDVPDTGLPIGRPFPHTNALLVDEQDLPVARGAAGELLFATDAMMQGYWRDPARTAKGFVTIKGTRYYRSGDLAVEQADGVYDMLGRKDRQIKVRGARMELDEVELALSSHPDVQEAAALVAPEGDAIIAAVVLKPGAVATPPALRAHAAASLPAYGVPRDVTVLARFPRTGSDKIDRRAIATQLAGT